MQYNTNNFDPANATSKVWILIPLEASLHLVPALPQRIGHALGNTIHSFEAKLGGHGERLPGLLRLVEKVHELYWEGN
jgi:hypothetical protein